MKYIYKDIDLSLKIGWIFIFNLFIVFSFIDVLQNNFLPEMENIVIKNINICDINSFNQEHINKSLNPFINLFNKNGSTQYFPSYFLPSNITCNHKVDILQYILYKQYNILTVHTTLINDYLKGVFDIITEYQNINDDIILSHSKITLRE